ncbi:MAG: cytochrome C peroxidase, partial [Pseudomonadota bacterium]
ANLPDIPWLAATDFVVQSDQREMERQTRAIKIQARSLDDSEIADIVAFLQALTGDSVDNPPFGVPSWFKP